jgi:hypothetical protein
MMFAHPTGLSSLLKSSISKRKVLLRRWGKPLQGKNSRFDFERRETIIVESKT